MSGFGFLKSILYYVQIILTCKSVHRTFRILTVIRSCQEIPIIDFSLSTRAIALQPEPRILKPFATFELNDVVERHGVITGSIRAVKNLRVTIPSKNTDTGPLTMSNRIESPSLALNLEHPSPRARCQLAESDRRP